MNGQSNDFNKTESRVDNSLLSSLLWIYPHYPPAAHGASNRAEALTKVFARCFGKVHIICFGVVDQCEQIHNITIDRITRRSNLSTRIHMFDSRWVSRALGSAEIHRYSIIIVSYPSREALEVGIRLKKMLRLPLIIELRDGLFLESRWSETSSLSPKTLLRVVQLKALERLAVRYADYLICVSEHHRSSLTKHYAINKIANIPNGYNDLSHESEVKVMEEGTERPGLKEFRIVYTGRFSLSDPDRRIDLLSPLLEAVSRNEEFSNIRFLFAGEFTDDEFGFLRKHSNVASYVGSLNREEVKDLQRSADALLVVNGSKLKGILTGKFFEYIGTGKRVIALTFESELSLLVANLGQTIIHPEDSQETIVQKMRAMLSTSPDREKYKSLLEVYSWSSLEKTYIKVVGEILQEMRRMKQ